MQCFAHYIHIDTLMAHTTLYCSVTARMMITIIAHPTHHTFNMSGRIPPQKPRLNNAMRTLRDEKGGRMYGVAV